MQATKKIIRDTRRAALEARVGKDVTKAYSAQYAGMRFVYYIIPRSDVPADLQLGVMQLTPDPLEWEACGRNPDEAFFALSDAVPEAHRPYWILHEIVEFLHCGTGTGCDCERASAMELALVLSRENMDFARAHMALRQEFFRQLFQFFWKNEHPAAHNFEDSVRFWEKNYDLFRIPETA